MEVKLGSTTVSAGANGKYTLTWAEGANTVTVKVTFTDKKHPEEDFDKSFSAYSEYDSTNTLDAVESSLCAEIIEKLVEDIFNATVAEWR